MLRAGGEVKPERLNQLRVDALGAAAAGEDWSAELSELVDGVDDLEAEVKHLTGELQIAKHRLKELEDELLMVRSAHDEKLATYRRIVSRFDDLVKWYDDCPL